MSEPLDHVTTEPLDHVTTERPISWYQLTHLAYMTTQSDDGSPVKRATRSAVDTVEAYEDDGNVVFYDAENPLAWVEASLAIDLGDYT